jgi:tyrosine-protein kinase Etk/Wzc
MSPSFDPRDYHVFYFSDFLYILKSFKKRALFFGSMAALFFLGSLGGSSPHYQAEGLFYDSGVKNPSSNSLPNFLPLGFDFFPKQEMQATTLMKSRQLLKKVVEKLGLQVQCERSFRFRYGDNCIAKIRSEMGFPKMEEELFSFSDVSFLSEKPKRYFFYFHSPTNFDLLDSQGTKIFQGKVGEKVYLENLQFLLHPPKKNFSLKKKYSLTFLPWLSVVDTLFDQISILPEKRNPNFLRVKVSHPSRTMAMAVVNQVICEYEFYLKDENDRIVKNQLSYLEKRQKELSSQLEQTLNDQVGYLEKNLGTKGFIGLESEAQSYLTLRQSYLTKLSDLDYKIQFLKEKGENALGEEALAYSQKIEELKRKRDPLDLSVGKKRICSQKKSFGNTPWIDEKERVQKVELVEHRKEKIEKRAKDLEEIREKKQEILFVLEELKKESFDVSREVSFPQLKKLIEVWKVSEEGGVRKKDLCSSLDHLYHLLAIEEKMLQEDPFSFRDVSSDIEGMDLEGARKLFLEYSISLENARLKKAEYDRIQKELFDAHFEIASLSSLFEDSVTRELIGLASKLSLNLCDERNYSPKERGRFREELMVKKVFLSQHLQEMAQRESLKSSMFEEKLFSLQEIILDRLNQEISILEQQKKESVDTRRENCKGEKELLETRLSSLKEEMSDLPQKWKKEKELKFQTDVGLKIIDALTENIESKNLLLHLQTSGSKPIDFASAALEPKSCHLVIFLLASMVLGIFFTYFFGFFYAAFRGLPVSAERLKDLGFSVCGYISSLCEELSSSQLVLEDLESMRRIILFLEKEKSTCPILALLSNKGPNYSHSLADLLSRKGKRVLLIDTSFTSSSKNQFGFLHYLSHAIEECPIVRTKTFDLLMSGEENLYGTEVLGSKGFTEMIACLKEKYDVILLYNKSSLKSMESQILLPLSDFLILTYGKETLSELKPFTDWANFDKKSRLMLVGVKSEG